MSKIAFLGIGAMGLRMVKNLLKSNHEVIVYNRTLDTAEQLVAQGAKLAATPTEAASQADIIISMVTNNEASKSIWLANDTGAIYGLRKNSIAIECSTLNPDWITQLHEELIKIEVEFLDAPVVGSRPQAELGELIFLVGGSKTTLNRAEHVLSSMSSSIHHMGDVSAGSTMKLVVNTLFGIQVAAFGEVLGIVEKSGVFSNSKALEVLNSIPTTSPAMKGIGGLIVNGNTDPLFPIHLVEKDFSYMLDIADKINAKATSTKVAHETYKKAISAGFGEENISGVSQLYN